MTDEAIPAGFSDAFLDWFQERTEAAWATYEPKTFEYYVTTHVGGMDWQRGTRWLKGLSEREVERIELYWSVHFPPDYRRFLRRLHAPDRPMRGAVFTDVIERGQQRSRMVRSERSAFYNWLVDEHALRTQLNSLIEGLAFDVENSDLWPLTWGQKPNSEYARRARIADLIAAAPSLIPVYAHRYLVGEPKVEGNPVLSIHQSDIIVYGPELRSYFLVEFADLLGIDASSVRREAEIVTNLNSARYAAIPFWGELWFGT